MGKKKGKKKKGQKTPTNAAASRSIPLGPEMTEALKEQFRRFEEKFGRPPGPDDPLFFDPSADEPRPTPRRAHVHDSAQMSRTSATII
jgi:hypothetical protein